MITTIIRQPGASCVLALSALSKRQIKGAATSQADRDKESETTEQSIHILSL